MEPDENETQPVEGAEDRQRRRHPPLRRRDASGRGIHGFTSGHAAAAVLSASAAVAVVHHRGHAAGVAGGTAGCGPSRGAPAFQRPQDRACSSESWRCWRAGSVRASTWPSTPRRAPGTLLERARTSPSRMPPGSFRIDQVAQVASLAIDPVVVDIDTTVASAVGKRRGSRGGNRDDHFALRPCATNNHVVESATNLRVTIEGHSGSYKAQRRSASTRPRTSR